MDNTPAPEGDEPMPLEIKSVQPNAIPAIELVDPLGSWAVDYAAQKWNVSLKDAAIAIGSKNLGKKIDKRDFITLITGEQA
jgi:hypothetical protein